MNSLKKLILAYAFCLALSMPVNAMQSQKDQSQTSMKIDEKQAKRIPQCPACFRPAEKNTITTSCNCTYHAKCLEHFKKITPDCLNCWKPLDEKS